jgi:glycerol kinase
MKGYLLALDQGSTSSRAMIFDHQGRLPAHAQAKLPTLLPKPGWVEHNPKQLLLSQLSAANQALNQLGSRKNQPLALGIANQRSTILLWERETGHTLAPAISWQDRRASELCKSLGHPSNSKTANLIHQKTGLRLTPYYAAPKLAWLLEHIKGARNKAENGELLCGTVNTYLIWHLTNGKAHVTDHTNAARMLLMNLSTLDWDPKLLDLFGIPSQMLPRIVSTCEYLGEAQIGKHQIPIFCSIGDQQAASIGLGCIEKGDITLNYGTGGFLLFNTGNHPQSIPGLLTSIAWSSPKKISYLLEGTVNSVGSALDWLRESLGVFKNINEIPRLYNQSKHPAFVIPSLAGLGAPHWREDVPTLFFNIHRETRRADLVRGMVEGIAFLMMDILEAMKTTDLNRFGRLRAGGGLANLDVLLQFQADLFQIPIERPATVEATAWGAAFLAGLGCGVWSDPLQIQGVVKKGRTFKPQISKQRAEELYSKWKKLLSLVLQWSSEQS